MCILESIGVLKPTYSSRTSPFKKLCFYNRAPRHARIRAKDGESAGQARGGVMETSLVAIGGLHAFSIEI